VAVETSVTTRSVKLRRVNRAARMPKIAIEGEGGKRAGSWKLSNKREREYTMMAADAKVERAAYRRRTGWSR
jgi:hypothetical protein